MFACARHSSLPSQVRSAPAKGCVLRPATFLTTLVCPTALTALYPGSRHKTSFDD
jgi:hypothetical protein